jgi:hypothetical protein
LITATVVGVALVDISAHNAIAVDVIKALTAHTSEGASGVDTIGVITTVIARKRALIEL